MKKAERMKRDFFSQERRKMTYEQRWEKGIKEDCRIIAGITPEERGSITVENLDEVRSMIISHYSVTEVMRRFGASRRAVYAAIEEEEPECLRPLVVVPTQRSKYARFRPTEQECKQITSAYEAGKASREIAKAHETSPAAIKRVLKKAGVELRDERNDCLSRAPRLCLTDENRIWVLYDSGITSPAEIVRRMDAIVTRAQVAYCLKRFKS